MDYTFQRIRILLFSESLYGDHSGYPMVQAAIALQFPNTNKIEIRSRTQRILQKAASLFRIGRAAKNPYWFSEYAFTDRAQIDRHTIYHCLSFSTTPGLWRRHPGEKNLIGTLHFFDPGDLPPETIEDLRHMTSAITLAHRHVPVYEGIIGNGRVRFIHHGVDTRFFCPSTHRRQARRLLFVGRVARNFGMLKDVLTALVPRYPDLRYDLVLTQDVIESALGEQLKAIPGTHVYSRISDLHLRSLYQSAFLLLLPLHEAGANNSIVEALASGLPIVTTDASGVYSYGGDQIYPVARKGDVEQMVALVERYLADADLHAQIGEQSRSFAEQFLDWKKVARAHLQAYEQLYH